MHGHDLVTKNTFIDEQQLPKPTRSSSMPSLHLPSMPSLVKTHAPTSAEVEQKASKEVLLAQYFAEYANDLHTKVTALCLQPNPAMASSLLEEMIAVKAKTVLYYDPCITKVEYQEQVYSLAGLSDPCADDDSSRTPEQKLLFLGGGC